jgi:thioredoxin 1
VAGKNVIELNDANWKKEVLESGETPVLVDFWAPWCGPCRAVGPLVEELAGDYAGRLKVGKLNVDDARGVAGQYQIRSIPTILLFKGGKVVGQRVGAGSKKDLEALVAKAM